MESNGDIDPGKISDQINESINDNPGEVSALRLLAMNMLAAGKWSWHVASGVFFGVFHGEEPKK